MISKPLALILCLICSCLHGQDLHYSQFDLNPMQLCPAAAGVFDGDLRAAVMYRSQWQQVPVAYHTGSGAMDWKLTAGTASQFGIGVQVQQDKAGDAGLSWTQAGLNLGAGRYINANNLLAVGFGAALIQRKFDIGGLTFQNQWNGDYFNPGLPTGEHLNHTSGLAPSLGAGMLWHGFVSDSRSEWTLAGGAAHLNHPVVNLGDFENGLARRISFYGTACVQIHYLYDLVFLSEYQKMAKAREAVIGAGIRRILTTGIANETNLQFTLSFRLHDALIPAIQFQRNNWLVGISYDCNLSQFDTATRGRGGIEIAAIWRRIPVPALKTVISCPPF